MTPHDDLHTTLGLPLVTLAGDPCVVLCPAVPLAAPAVTLMGGAPASPPRTGPSKLPHVLQRNP